MDIELNNNDIDVKGTNANPTSLGTGELVNTSQAKAPSNAAFWWSLVDPVPMFVPMTVKRAVWLTALFGSIASLAYLETRDQYLSLLARALNTHLFALMILICAYEPSLLLLYMMFSKYPEETKTQRVGSEQERGSTELDLESLTEPKNDFLAIVIPCHHSSDVIKTTILACLAHVSPGHLFIADNSSETTPPDDTKAIVHAVDNSIRYLYYPTASKTIALLTTVDYIKKHCPTIQYILLIDDDVLVPARFTVRMDFLKDPEVKGIVYPIRAISSSTPKPLIVRWQDLEYQLSDLEMAFLDRNEAVIRPHGAVSLWKVDILSQVLHHHNGIFKGDDVMMGLILQHMHSQGERYSKLRVDLTCYFETLAPESFLGLPPNLYTQRVRSWKEAQYLYFWNLALKPILTVWSKPPLALLAIKNSQLYNLHTQLTQIVRFPLMFYFGGNPRYWMVVLGCWFLNESLIAAFNFIKLPEQQRNNWQTVLTYPAYQAIDSLLGTLAFLRAIFVSGPVAPYHSSIDSRIRRHRLFLPESNPSPRSPGQLALGTIRTDSSAQLCIEELNPPEESLKLPISTRL